MAGGGLEREDVGMGGDDGVGQGAGSPDEGGDLGEEVEAFVVESAVGGYGGELMVD